MLRIGFAQFVSLSELKILKVKSGCHSAAYKGIATSLLELDAKPQIAFYHGPNSFSVFQSPTQF